MYIPYRTISSHIEGVSPYMFSASRHEARYWAAQRLPPPTPPPVRERVSHTAVYLFVEWLIENLTPMPWGEKVKQLSTGQKVGLPPYMSNMLKVRLISSFRAYMEQTNQADLLLSDSTYYKILKNLKLHYRQSVAGLDYKTNAGLEGFEMLEKILSRLTNLQQIEPEQKKELAMQLHRSSNYLRGDFKYNIKTHSQVADHCSTFALSDPSNSLLRDPQE